MPVPFGLIKHLVRVSLLVETGVSAARWLTLYTQSIIEAASWDSISLSDEDSLSNECDNRRSAYVL